MQLIEVKVKLIKKSKIGKLKVKFVLFQGFNLTNNGNKYTLFRNILYIYIFCLYVFIRSSSKII